MDLDVVTLGTADAARIEAHLLRLSPEDRSLRFAAGVVSDETIRRHVAGIRFGHDALLGIVDRHGLIVGIAHGCVFEARSCRQIEAAFSVDAAWRGHGLGSRLMTAILEYAAATGTRAVVGMCVARNLPMRRVFESAGMTMAREDNEMHACREIAAQPVRARGGDAPDGHPLPAVQAARAPAAPL